MIVTPEYLRDLANALATEGQPVSAELALALIAEIEKLRRRVASLQSHNDYLQTPPDELEEDLDALKDAP